jgi:prefoldin subunit 5
MNPQEAEEQLGLARQQIAVLEGILREAKEVIEDLSDHGVAAERMNMLRTQQYMLRTQQFEIDHLRQEIERLKGPQHGEDHRD